MSICARASALAAIGSFDAVGHWEKYPAAIFNGGSAPANALNSPRKHVALLVVPSVQTDNRQSDSSLSVIWLVVTPNSDAVWSPWLNKLTILPRFNRIHARRSSRRSEVLLPSFVNLRSSILISEFQDS